VLYVSYDGALEALGESQVVAYLERLAGLCDITLLSFEKPADLMRPAEVTRMNDRLARSHIRWLPLRYHRYPPVVSTAYDVLRGFARACVWSLRGPRGFVHARSYVPALIALWLRRCLGTGFLFDMRGFWADERVDGGHWPSEGPMYRLAKRCERRFFEGADAIVSLTHEAVRVFPALGYDIPRHTRIEVIPTCTDLERFTPGAKDPVLVSRLGLSGRVVVGTTGTLSNWYLREATLEAFAELARRRADVSILMVTKEDHDRLRADAVAAGLPPERLTLVSAHFSEMPEYVRLMDLGLFFIKPLFSKKGTAATKLGEFLACGVPVVINEGIGDSDRIVRDCQAGVVLPNPADVGLQAALADVERLLADPGVKQRCRDAARRYFDLEDGAARYAQLYDGLLADAAGRRFARVR
jgi:glycosyltransferase involved in cell wall biosynthesis